jgi:hypothetical protein
MDVCGQAWSGLFCRLPAVLLQQIEKRLIGKVLKFLLPIACQQFKGIRSRSLGDVAPKQLGEAAE